MWSYVFLVLIVLFVSMVFEDTNHEFWKALTMYKPYRDWETDRKSVV